MGRHILLLDESAMLRRIAVNVLQAQPAHYRVHAATRASEGFARACAGEAELILLDEKIASAAEPDFCQRLLQEPRTAAVPVVLLSNREDTAAQLADWPTNVVDVLQKPFTPDQLVEVVNWVADFNKQGASLPSMRQALHPDVISREQSVPSVEPTTAWISPIQPLEAEEIIAYTPDDPPATGAEEFRTQTSIRTALQSVQRTGETGVFRFHTQEPHATELFVENGRVVVVSTHDAALYAQRALEALPDKVSPATIQEATEEQTRTGVPFLLILGARGLLSKAAAVSRLKEFGQRCFARLWDCPPKHLRITFEPLEALPGFALRLEPSEASGDAWLLETLRIRNPAALQQSLRHQGSVGTPEFRCRGADILDALPLTAKEKEFARRINGRHDLPTIAKTAGLAVEEAFEILQRFVHLEAVKYHPAPKPFVMTPRTRARQVLPRQR